MATTTTKKDYDDEFVDIAQVERKLAGKKDKSTEELIKDSIKSDTEIQTKVNRLRDNMAREPKTKIRVSPAYKPYLGSRCQILINGVAIVIPVDGSMIEVPESYAAEMYRRMNGIDAMLDKQVKMSQYNQNREQSIGEIKF